MSLESAKDETENYCNFSRMMSAIFESVNESYLKIILQQKIYINYRISSSDSIGKNLYSSGATALHIACKKCERTEDLRKIKLLLDFGADYTIKDDCGMTPLHEAFRRPGYCEFYGRSKGVLENKSIIDLILDVQIASGNTSNPRTNDGLSHFHIACATNNVRAIEFFLANGEDIDQRVYTSDRYRAGWSPMHFVVNSRAFDAAILLLKNNASLQLKNAKRLNPLHLCLNYNMALSAALYNDKKEDEERKNSLSVGKLMMKLLIISCNKRNDVTVDEYGLSEFHLVCSIGDVKMIESYSNQVNDVNQAVKLDSVMCPGYTALHFAALSDIKSVMCLLEKGADLLIKDASGVSPLDICLKHYSISDICSILNTQQSWRELLLSDDKTKLVDLVSVMRNYKKFKKFSRTRDLKNLFIRNNSSLWPGYTILHLVVTLIKTIWKLQWIGFAETLVVDIDRDIINEIRIFGNNNSENENDSENATGGEDESDDEDRFFDREWVRNDHLKIMRKCLRLGIEVTAQDAQGSTPLHLAFHSGKIEIVGTLLHYHPADVNPVDKHNLSHLHIACAARNVNVVRKLILNGADIKIRVASTIKWFTLKKREHGKYYPFFIVPGSTALHIAVASRSEKIVSILLKNEADVNAIDEYGMTPIHRCLTADYNDNREIGALLMKSLELKNITIEKFGFSHLHVASCLGDRKAIKRFLDQEADINAPVSYCNIIDDIGWSENLENRDPYGDLKLGTPYAFLHNFLRFTPLHFSMLCKENSQTVKLLIERGADLFNKLPGRLTIMHDILSDRYINEELMPHVLAKLKNDSIFRDDVKERTGMTMLHLGCHINDVDIMRECLNAGEDVNAKIHVDSPIYPGCTVLHILMMRKLFDEDQGKDDQIFQLLCENNIDMSLVDVKNETAIHKAYDKGKDPPWINKIFENYEDFSRNVTDDRGLSLLHIACFTKNKAIIENFLKHGADPNQSIIYLADHGGYTSLHAVACNDWQTLSLEIVDLLLEYEADVNAKDRYGNTLLHIFASRNGVKRQIVFKKLFYAGADINAMNMWYQTPFELLLNTNSITMDEIDFFLDRGCHINSFNPVSRKGFMSKIFTRYSNFALGCLSKLFECEMDDMGRSVLHNVVSNFFDGFDVSRWDYGKFIDQLIDRGYDIDHQDKEGKTALHLAVEFVNDDAISALLKVGVDINIQDANGKTAYVSGIESFEDYKAYHLRGKYAQKKNKIPKLFAKYTQKLQLAKIFVHESNLLVHNKVLKDHSIDIDEIEEKFEEVNKIKIGESSITVLDALSEIKMVAAYRRMLPEDRKFFDEFFKTIDDNKKYYPLSKIKCLFKLQYRQALKRSALVQKAKDSMTILFEFLLPDICSEGVIEYLVNTELKNLIESTRDLPAY